MKQHNLFWGLRALFLIMVCFFVLNLAQAAYADEQPAEYTNLIENVQKEGQLPVIVTLSLKQPYQVEGNLSTVAVQAQRTAIAVAQESLIKQLSDYDAEVYVQYEIFPLMAVKVDKEALEFLIDSPEVAYLEEDVAVPPTLLSSTAVIGAPTVWADGFEGNGQTVVVLDTGIDSDHPFFTGRIPVEHCFSNQNGGGVNTTLCPDGTGEDTSADVENAACSTTAANDGDLCTHGSHVAGIAAGADNAGSPGYDGVARGADIIPIQVFTRFNSDGDCGGGGTAPCVLTWNTDQILALQYVLTTLEPNPSYDIASVNMSLGGGIHTSACDTDSRKSSIDSLIAVDIATIIASGNNGYTNAIGAPGCISTAVTVGATTDADSIASFSNSNSLIDLLAPGVAIDSSVPDNDYANQQGTSMATPHVAGAWAVLKEVVADSGASDSVADILTALQENGISITDTRNGITRSRIQLDRAAAALQPATWIGTTTNWSTDSNWSTASLPRCGTPITIPTTPSGGNFPTIDADTAVGAVTLEDGAQLNMSANTLSVCGDWTAAGTGQFNATGGTTAFVGGTSQDISLPASTNGQFYDVQIGDGVPPLVVSFNSNIDIANDITILYPASVDANGNTLSVAGNWVDNGKGFTPNSGTVIFNGTTQAVSNPTFEIMNESFADATGATGYSSAYLPGGWVREHASGYGFLGGDLSSNGVAIRWDDSSSAWLHSSGLELETGVVYELEYKYRLLTVSGTPNGDFSVHLGTAQNSASMSTLLDEVTNVSSAGFATRSQTFTVNSNDTYYLGLYSDQNVDVSYGVFDDVIVRGTPTEIDFYDVQINQGTTTFAQNLVAGNDLSIANGAILNLGDNAASVEGTVTNNGRFRQELDTPNGSTTSFLHIQNAAGDTDKYFGVDITPSAAMGNTEVILRGGQTCGTGGTLSNGVMRCYDITPGTDETATIRFYYRDVEANGNSAPDAYHYSGSDGNWNPLASSNGGSGEGLWAEATNVGDYSPFALADTEPTAVSLTNGSASMTQSNVWLLSLILGLSLLSFFVYKRQKG